MSWFVDGRGSIVESEFWIKLQLFTDRYRGSFPCRLREDSDARCDIDEFERKFNLDETAGLATYYLSGLIRHGGFENFPTEGALEQLHKLQEEGRAVLSTFLETEEINMGLKPDAVQWLNTHGSFLWPDFVNAARISFALLAANLLWNSGVETVEPIGPRHKVVAILCKLEDLYIHAYFCAAQKHFRAMDVGSDLYSLCHGSSALMSTAYNYNSDAQQAPINASATDRLGALITMLKTGYENQQDEPSTQAPLSQLIAWEEWEWLLERVNDSLEDIENGRSLVDREFDIKGFFQAKGLVTFKRPYLQYGMFFFEAARRDLHLRDRMDASALFSRLNDLRTSGRKILSSCLKSNHPLGTMQKELPEGITMGKIRKLVEVVAPLDAANHMRYNPFHFKEYKLSNYGFVFAANIDVSDKPNTFALNSLDDDVRRHTLCADGLICGAINELAHVYANVFHYHREKGWFKNVLKVESRLRDLLLRLQELPIEGVNIPEPLPHCRDVGTWTMKENVFPEVLEGHQKHMKEVQMDVIKEAISSCDDRYSKVWTEGSKFQPDPSEFATLTDQLQEEQCKLLSILEENAKVMAITHFYCLGGTGHDHFQQLLQSGIASVVKEFNSGAIKVADRFIRICRMFNTVAAGHTEWKQAKQFTSFISSSDPRQLSGGTVTGLGESGSEFTPNASVNRKLVRYSTILCEYGLSYITPEYLTSYECMVDFLLFLARCHHSDSISGSSAKDLDLCYDVPDRNFRYFPQFGERVPWSERDWVSSAWADAAKCLGEHGLMPLIPESALNNVTMSSDIGQAFNKAKQETSGARKILEQLDIDREYHAMETAEVTFHMMKSDESTGDDKSILLTTESPKFDIVKDDFMHYWLDVSVCENYRAQLRVLNDSATHMVGVKVAEIADEDAWSDESMVSTVANPNVLTPRVTRNGSLKFKFRVDLSALVPREQRTCTKNRRRIGLYLSIQSQSGEWYTMARIPLKIVDKVSMSSRLSSRAERLRNVFRRHSNVRRVVKIGCSIALTAATAAAGAPIGELVVQALDI